MKPHTRNKNWLQMTVPVSNETNELVSNFLFEIGVEGVVEGKGILTAYFPPPFSSDKLVQLVQNYLDELKKMGHSIPSITIRVDEIQDRDWNEEWKKNYGLVWISDRILIKPSWTALPQNPPQCTIEIDPEMAFGTGTHATTSLTLRLLQKNIHGNERILDIGTGTGILSIAAVMLGAKEAIAFDIDPVAAHTAVHNAMKNKVNENIHVFAGSLQSLVKTKFDVIVANVNRSVILKLLFSMPELLDYDGKIILSGILDSEETMLRDAFTAHRLQVLEMASEDEWVAFEVAKQQ